MTTNYYARVDYTYQGGDRIFSIPFDYIKEEHLNVMINNETCSQWSTLSTSQIEIDESVDLSVSDKVTIVRTTPLDERMVVFSDTSILNKDNQNLAHEQIFDVVQEVHDSLNSHKQDVEILKPYIQTAAENIEHIIAVDENAENINTVSDSIDNVNAVGQNTTNINTVANNLTPIISVSDSIHYVNAVGSHIDDVHTVSNNIDAVYDFAVQKDMVKQSKGLISGNVSSDADVLEQIKQMAHSTFDLSKFTVVGSPTITDDGIASGFSSSNYINTIQLSELANKSWDVEGAFEFIPMSSGNTSLLGLTPTYAVRGALYYNSTGNVIFGAFIGVTGDATSEGAKITLSNILTTTGKYYYKLSFNLLTGKYTLSIYDSNKVLINSGEYTPPTTNKQLWDINNNPTTYISIGRILSGITDSTGSIDLKQFSITVDGVKVFSGNKTGVDTYTISDSTVTVPYTLSKTGSKIVDSNYRTQVNAVYNEYGYAPYYTLSDNDFTLPMGELYGMIDSKISKSGGTMTGNLKIEDIGPRLLLTNTQIDQTTTPATSHNAYVGFRDKDDNQIGVVGSYHNSENNIATHMVVHRLINNVNVSSDIRVGVYPDGTFYTKSPACDENHSILTTEGLDKSLNGYVKLGNGIVLQWGTASISTSATSITFPIAFANAVRVCMTKVKDTNTRTEDWWIKSVSKTGFIAQSSESDNIHWIAIGY